METRLRIQANNFLYTFQNIEIKEQLNGITLIMIYTGRSAGYTCPSDKDNQILGPKKIKVFQCNEEQCSTYAWTFQVVSSEQWLYYLNSEYSLF